MNRLRASELCLRFVSTLSCKKKKKKAQKLQDFGLTKNRWGDFLMYFFSLFFKHMNTVTLILALKPFRTLKHRRKYNTAIIYDI